MEIGCFLRESPLLITVEGLQFMLAHPRVKVMLLMLVYMVSPVDLLPEVLLGPLGLLDDSLVMISFASQFSGLLVNFVGQEALREQHQN
jgi:uncharacterized membrane protein YkvA (DUF1232 family)